MRMVAQYLLSLIFIAQMYLAMLVLAIWWTPFVLFRRDAAFDAVHSYCRWVRWSAKVLVGLRSEIRGEVPRDFQVVRALCSDLPQNRTLAFENETVWYADVCTRLTWGRSADTMGPAHASPRLASPRRLARSSL